MTRKNFILALITVILFSGGLLHFSNFQAKHQYAPPPIEEIVLPDIHFPAK